MRLQIAAPLLGGLLGGGLLAGGSLAAALPASAAPTGQGSGNPTLSATPATNLPATGKTTVQVRGIDYLMPTITPGTQVTGGIYVFFGWVDQTKKAWGPSARNINNTDGNFGRTYLYPGEGGSGETREGQSGTSFVSFTASGESGSATEYHMDSNGNWTAPVEVPGAVFTTQVPGGGTKTTDCRQVTCGIFTIGAHGKASATNEKFTPLRFAGAAGPGSTAGPSPSAQPTGSASPRPSSSASPTASPTRSTSGYDANGAPTRLPQTGIAEDAPVPVAPAPVDGRTVALGVSDVSESGNGGGLALFGVAALVALVVALTISLFWRYGARD
jgi:hypothetical protein